MTQKIKSLGKPWKTLVTAGPIPRHLERVEAVAHFRLTTGHDFWVVYLVTNIISTLVDDVRDQERIVLLPEIPDCVFPYPILRHNLNWLGLTTDEACPLCGQARMNGDHRL
ncbi:uncharacterized protein TNCV_907161 [Trichonephila clavipes]|nr:uncharacterized protein TNCV_907161 [Trichonephila clavipes]